MTSTIGEILPVAARRFGARTALIVGDRSFSFDDLQGLVGLEQNGGFHRLSSRIAKSL